MNCGIEIEAHVSTILKVKYYRTPGNVKKIQTVDFLLYPYLFLKRVSFIKTPLKYVGNKK